MWMNYRGCRIVAVPLKLFCQMYGGLNKRCPAVAAHAVIHA